MGTEDIKEVEVKSTEEVEAESSEKVEGKNEAEEISGMIPTGSGAAEPRVRTEVEVLKSAKMT